MRVARVVGRVTLSSAYATLEGGRFLLAQTLDRHALAGKPGKGGEVLVVYDHLGAGEGEMIAVAESREACMPFYPERVVPIDAYCGAILDRVAVELEI
jgi:microcompartment protein CcmK/EutM